jgi:cytidylate kinase
MIVTIDGPAGAGKSSVARQLAKRLRFRFLDTGAMYRAVAWAMLRAGIDFQDQAAMERLVAALDLQICEQQVLLNGEDITIAIRSPEVTRAVRPVADNVVVRQKLSEWQRQFAQQGDTVTEGRDQGTVVFPEAECKIFLTASPQQRAERRYRELTQRGESVTYDEILTQQNERDAQDAGRSFGAMVKAPDAVEVCTDDRSIEEVLDQLEKLVRRRAK